MSRLSAFERIERPFAANPFSFAGMDERGTRNFARGPLFNA
jgi:hypothetical protein